MLEHHLLINMPRYKQINIDGEWKLLDMSLNVENETSAPYIMSDVPDYTSPVDGRLVSGRKQRREDLKRHGCVEYDPGVKDDAKRIKKQRDQRLEHSLKECMEKTAIQLRDGNTKKETRINPLWLLEK